MHTNANIVNSNFATDIQQTTCGDFVTEEEACNFFDIQLEGGKYFDVEKEVIGRRLVDFLPCPPGHSGQKIRIDRILHPTQYAIQNKWVWGPIGVEIKKSNMAIGPALAQVLEQRQTIFQSKKLGFARISILLHAIFPIRKLNQDLHSLCETQSVLICYYDSYRNWMKFCMPTRHILAVSKTHIEVSESWKPTVKKGHRGRAK